MIAKKTVHTLLASAVALTIAGAAASAVAEDMAGHEPSADKEKCYGVVKAGMNDCAAGDKSHSCATMAGSDASGNEWIALPAGVCEKLVNGSLTPVAAAPAEGEAPAAEGEAH